MTRDVFVTTAMPWLLEVEGRYSLDSQDSGNWTGGAIGVGELRGTKYGISSAAFPHLDIGSLTVEQAREIYRRSYWDAVRGDNLPPILALAAFDGAVQHGARTSARHLQSALHVAGDGVIGPKTLDAAHHSSPIAVLPRMLRQRAEIYRKHPKADRYFDGWMDRLFRLEIACMRLALSEGISQ